MSAIDFVIRTGAGRVEKGVVGGDAGSLVELTPYSDISFNLDVTQMRGYLRDGTDLVMELADGSRITIKGFFGPDGEPMSELFLSGEGSIRQVTFDGADGDILFASYAAPQQWDKWSDLDDLIFLDRPDVMVADYAVGSENETSMLATLGAVVAGGGAVGAGGVVAVAGGALAVGALTDGGGSGGGSGEVTPGGSGGSGTVAATVDGTGTEVGINDATAISSGETIIVTGTATPGSTVSVDLGGATEVTTAGEDGAWEVEFSGGSFPDDGTHTADVTVTYPDGSTEDLTGPTYEVDRTPPPIEVETVTVGAGDVVSGSEMDAGVVISGEGEAGASMVVTVNGTELDAVTVAPDGSWSVTVPAGVLPEGETTVQASFTSTDAMGNSTTVVDTIKIDTVTNLDAAGSNGGADLVVNSAEAASGVSFAGTAEPGASVKIDFGGASQTVITDENGVWSAQFSSATIPDGSEGTLMATVTATDAYGNTAVDTVNVQYDTVLRDFAMSSDQIETDNIVNAAERVDGVPIAGTAEAGSQVAVTVNGQTYNTVSDANGNWSVTVPAATIPQGELTLPVSVTATDTAGNTATTSQNLEIDTLVNALSSNDVEGDDAVTLAEAQDGIQVTGLVEPGSSVSITVGGYTFPAVVAADGTWTADLPDGLVNSLNGTQGVMPMTITATDAAGNVLTLNDSFSYDFDAPDAVLSTQYTRDDTGTTGIAVAENNETVDVQLRGSDGSVQDINESFYVASGGDKGIVFTDGAVADGSQLILASTDAAGNMSSTLMVTNSADTVTFDLNGADLSGFNIQAIDLTRADHTDLTITEDDLAALAATSDLFVHGNGDDTVRLEGVTQTSSATYDGTNYNVYALGTAGQVIVEEDVTVVIGTT